VHFNNIISAFQIVVFICLGPTLIRKAVLENAVRHYAEKIDAEQEIDVFSYTFGSWQRDESAADTVKSVKGTMRQSQERYKR
jgi:hypothetical protein